MTADPSRPIELTPIRSRAETRIGTDAMTYPSSLSYNHPFVAHARQLERDRDDLLRLADWRKKNWDAMASRIGELKRVAAPLVAIATAYHNNALDESRPEAIERGVEAYRQHCDIELFQGRGGKELLTLADCLEAERVIKGIHKLCEDEGCPQHGTDHVCVETLVQPTARLKLVAAMPVPKVGDRLQVASVGEAGEVTLEPLSEQEPPKLNIEAVDAFIEWPTPVGGERPAKLVRIYYKLAEGRAKMVFALRDEDKAPFEAIFHNAADADSLRQMREVFTTGHYVRSTDGVTVWVGDDGKASVVSKPRGDDGTPVPTIVLRAGQNWTDGRVMISAVESGEDLNAPVKRWPFRESPGEFAKRLGEAMHSFDHPDRVDSVALLAAVRTVLIEEPPVFANWALDNLTNSMPECKGAWILGTACGKCKRCHEEAVGLMPDWKSARDAISHLSSQLQYLGVSRPGRWVDLIDAAVENYRRRIEEGAAIHKSHRELVDAIVVGVPAFRWAGHAAGDDGWTAEVDPNKLGDVLDEMTSSAAQANGLLAAMAEQRNIQNRGMSDRQLDVVDEVLAKLRAAFRRPEKPRRPPAPAPASHDAATAAFAESEGLAPKHEPWCSTVATRRMLPRQPCNCPAGSHANDCATKCRNQSTHKHDCDCQGATS